MNFGALLVLILASDFASQAVLDTLLVLFIVAGSGALLFGCNVALAELSEWWYHRG